MIGRLHGLQSRVVDSGAFFGIGLWQLLGRAGRHSPQEWDDYVRNWLTRGGEEFFRDWIMAVVGPCRPTQPTGVG